MSDVPTSKTAGRLEADRLARLVGSVAASDPRILGLYLFGSRAQGEAHPASDVDLGVLFRGEVDIWDQLALENRLEETIGLPVDLLDMARAKPFLALEIVRGERLYEADGVACDEFDLFVLRRAGDLAPFERRKREMILRRGRSE